MAQWLGKMIKGCAAAATGEGEEKKVSSIAFDVAFTSQKDLSIERSRKSKSKLLYTLAKRIRIARLVYVFNSIFNDVERTFGI